MASRVRLWRSFLMLIDLSSFLDGESYSDHMEERHSLLVVATSKVFNLEPKTKGLAAWHPHMHWCYTCKEW